MQKSESQRGRLEPPRNHNEKQGHARVFNLVSFVSSTAFRPVKYRSLCYWGKFSRRGAFRFHSFQFSEVRLQVCSDW